MGFVMRNMLKSFVGAGAIVFAAFTAAPAAAAPDSETVKAVEVRDDDVFFGAAEAPVVIVEYASLTCPHCANFHANVLPLLKDGPIAAGKARLVFRDFPLDGLALRAAALTRCGGPGRRLAILGLLFEAQASWARASDPLAALAKIGKLAGLKEEASMACMEDRGMFDRIIAEAQEGEQQHGVRSTPSFIIGDQLYRGGTTAEELIEIIGAQSK